jgi:hypothetical protein
VRVDFRIDYEPICKMAGKINYRPNYFSEEKLMDHVHESMGQRRGRWSMIHGGPGLIPFHRIYSQASIMDWTGKEKRNRAAVAACNAIGLLSDRALEWSFGVSTLAARG